MASSRSNFLQSHKYETCDYKGTVRFETTYYDSYSLRIFHGVLFFKLKSEALECVEFHKWLRLLIMRRILSRGGSRIFVELLYESNKLITLVFQNQFKNLF